MSASMAESEVVHGAASVWSGTLDSRPSPSRSASPSSALDGQSSKG